MKERAGISRGSMFIVTLLAGYVGFATSDLFRGRPVEWGMHAASALVMGIFAALIAPYLPTGRR